MDIQHLLNNFDFPDDDDFLFIDDDEAGDEFPDLEAQLDNIVDGADFWEMADEMADAQDGDYGDDFVNLESVLDKTVEDNDWEDMPELDAVENQDLLGGEDDGFPDLENLLDKAASDITKKEEREGVLSFHEKIYSHGFRKDDDIDPSTLDPKAKYGFQKPRSLLHVYCNLDLTMSSKTDPNYPYRPTKKEANDSLLLEFRKMERTFAVRHFIMVYGYPFKASSDQPDAFEYLQLNKKQDNVVRDGLFLLGKFRRSWKTRDEFRRIPYIMGRCMFLPSGYYKVKSAKKKKYEIKYLAKQLALVIDRRGYQHYRLSKYLTSSLIYSRKIHKSALKIIKPRLHNKRPLELYLELPQKINMLPDGTPV